MRSITNGVLASVAALGLLAACGGDKLSLPTAPPNATTDATTAADATLPTGLTLPPGVTLPTGLTIPDGVTLPSGVSLPSDFTIPDATIDLMITQFEAAGMKVDKECFKNLLKDDSLRKLAEGGGTPTAEVMQKFFACVSA
jgi:hypothetical protein